MSSKEQGRLWSNRVLLRVVRRGKAARGRDRRTREKVKLRENFWVGHSKSSEYLGSSPATLAIIPPSPRTGYCKEVRQFSTCSPVRLAYSRKVGEISIEKSTAKVANETTSSTVHVA
jgi:hypothetical protein